MELNIEKFDPTVAELQEVASKARAIAVTDFADEEQLAQVATARKLLKAARVKITNRGKEMREEAVRFSKLVISKEKELVAIIEPEELRLKALEDEAEAFADKRRNALALPLRRQRLDGIGDILEVSDDELNAMNTAEFEGYFTNRLQAMAELERQKLAAERAAVEEEARKQRAAKEAAEAEEKARADERAKIAKEQEERANKAEREARERAEAIENEAREKAAKIEAEAKAKADAAKREQEAEASKKAAYDLAEMERQIREKEKQEKIKKQENYQKWVCENVKEGRVYEHRNKGDTVELWELVATFNE